VTDCPDLAKYPAPGDTLRSSLTGPAPAPYSAASGVAHAVKPRPSGSRTLPHDDASRRRQDDEDRDLAARSRWGSEEAFAEIVRRYAASLVTLARRVVRDPDEAEDVAQEALVKAYEALDRYDPAYPLRVWLFRIAYNTAIDHVRRRRGGTVSLDAPRRAGGEEIEWELADAESPDPHERLARRDRRDVLDRAMAQLPPALRAAIVLRHVEELSYEEIAAALGIPLGTVKIRIHRGREALAKILRREIGEEEMP
jgi:RNA polymerase sigma-70 factor (ECF subfamily)